MAFEMLALGGFMAGMMLFFIAWIILVVWALVDMLKASNEPTWKILWLLVIIIIPILGVILYYLIGREQKVKKRNNSRASLKTG